MNHLLRTYGVIVWRLLNKRPLESVVVGCVIILLMRNHEVSLDISQLQLWLLLPLAVFGNGQAFRSLYLLMQKDRRIVEGMLPKARARIVDGLKFIVCFFGFYSTNNWILGIAGIDFGYWAQAMVVPFGMICKIQLSKISASHRKNLFNYFGMPGAKNLFLGRILNLATLRLLQLHETRYLYGISFIFFGSFFLLCFGSLKEPQFEILLVGILFVTTFIDSLLKIPLTISDLKLCPGLRAAEVLGNTTAFFLISLSLIILLFAADKLFASSRLSADFIYFAVLGNLWIHFCTALANSKYRDSSVIKSIAIIALIILPPAPIALSYKIAKDNR